MRIRLNGLHLQLLGLIILPLGLLVLAVAFGAINIHQGAMRQLVAERDERSVRAAAAALSEHLHHRESAIYGIALRIEDAASPQLILDQTDYLVNDFNEGLAVTNLTGLPLAGSLNIGSSQEGKLKELLAGIQDGDVEFSDPLEWDNGEIVFLVVARRADQFVVGAFSISSLLDSGVISSSSRKESYRVILIDGEGNLLANVGLPLEDGNLLDHAGVQAAMRGETGSTFLPASDGEHVVAFSSILPTNWGLIIEETWEDVSSPLLDISLITPLSLAPILLVALFALWFGARRVVQPLRNLEHQAEKLASGDYDAIEESAGGIAEIQSLQQTLVSMARRIRAAQQALRGYIGSITRTQEEERRRLARDLHDETIQDLIALDQQIQMLGINRGQTEALDSKAIDKLHKDTQEAIQKVRRLSRGLRPIYLEDLGLIPAMEMLAKDVQDDLQIPISFQVDGAERRLDPVVEVAVYRIVQEALSNIGRHASASKVWIVGSFADEALNLIVGDNGDGFEMPSQTSELAYEGHYGLIGMHERVELIKGDLEIRSSHGQGTTISIQIPLTFDMGNFN